MTMKIEYEKNLKIKTPPTMRKAQPVLTKDDWNVIRAQVMEEKHDREALKNKIVPPYFSSEEGRAWLISQSQCLNDAAAAFNHKHGPSKRKRNSMSVTLADNDHQVY